MASEFSDPAWWPKPPPQPPKPISVRKIVVGTILPIIALIVGAVIVFTQHSSSSHSSSTQSIAAWNACLKAHGFTPGQTATDTNTARSAERACQGNLPPGTQVATFAAGNSPEEQFNDCMRSATAGIPRGRFSSAARDAIRNAYEVCQTLVQGGGSSQLEPTTTTAPSAPPAA
jgi:hypothetical protein